jgi:hypothetical protein
MALTINSECETKEAESTEEGGPGINSIDSTVVLFGRERREDEWR